MMLAPSVDHGDAGTALDLTIMPGLDVEPVVDRTAVVPPVSTCSCCADDQPRRQDVRQGVVEGEVLGPAERLGLSG